MYKKTFTLKQHTPIIHFQHEQHGATLRATEVKPKLDQYIIERCLTQQRQTWKHAHDAREKFKQLAYQAKEDHERYQWRDWLVGDQKTEHIALDYIMSIQDISNPKEIRKIHEIKLITDPIHTGILSKKIEMKIVCFQEGILPFIESVIAEFFVFHNFGTRQNKGWGSFTLEKTTLQAFEKMLTTNAFSFKRRNIQWTHPIKGNWDDQIKIDHQRLKSGLNHTSFKEVIGNNKGYEKSKLFHYFYQKQLGWDKKFIKQQIEKSEDFNYKLFRHNPSILYENSENEYRYVRALLGVAEHYEFQIDFQGRPDRNKKYKVKVGSLSIQRFKSPLTFKVFDDGRDKHLYLIVNDLPEEIFNQKFQFELGTRSKKNNGKESDDENFIDLEIIETPKKSEFDLKQFIAKNANNLNYLPLK